ncbi:MAG: OmpA family protein [Flavobacterium sp.]|nr:MAG: OmpA family protein [Flavobacterium sp.]
MKRYLLLMPFIALASQPILAQNDSIKKDRVMDSDPESYHRWTIEAGFGQSKGVKPYAPGYYYSNPNAHLRADVNHFDIGTRYMVSPKFGVKVGFSYDRLQDQEGAESGDFDMRVIGLQIQGVVNAVRLFSFEEAAGRFGLLFHGGFQATQMAPQVGINEGLKEYNGGIIVGFTPQFRVARAIGVYADFSYLGNVRQHFNWDGSYAKAEDNLSGSMYTFSLGLSYSFGRVGLHGDWAVIPDARDEDIQALDQRVGDLETMMNDTDKDGVPDYLDVENNSIAGVAVDTKGRMVDLNKNGVADELEKYIDTQVTTAAEKNNNSEVIKRLINEGYVSVFFDFNSSKPTPQSTQNMSFILTYLKNNPNATVDISGHADEIGSSEYNNSLSSKRAENVKNTLVKAGIDASRINIVPEGEDPSVDKNSDSARKLVRRATFTIK